MRIGVILLFLWLITGCSEEVTQRTTIAAAGAGAGGLGHGRLVKGDALEEMGAAALSSGMSTASVGMLSEHYEQKRKNAGTVDAKMHAQPESPQPLSEVSQSTDRVALLDDEIPSYSERQSMQSDYVDAKVIAQPLSASPSRQHANSDAFLEEMNSIPPDDREGRLRKLVEISNERTDNPGMEPSMSNNLGVDPSIANEYRIGVRDLVEVKVFQASELNDVSRVDSRGYISLPLLGRLHIANRTVSEAEQMIEKKLAESYLQDPHVTVNIQEYESQRITVEGWVKHPGIQELKGRTTLLQAIAQAAGLDKMADPEEILIFRRVEGGKIVGYKVDLDEIRAGEAKDPVLVANDVVVVPEHGAKALLNEITGTLRNFMGFASPFGL